MAAKIHPAPLSFSKAEQVFHGPLGVLVFSNSTVEEQEKTKLVSKRWKEQTIEAQRREIIRRFPEAHLALAGGDLRGLPLRTIPTIENDQLTERLRSFPERAIGWMKVAPDAWTIYLFKREVTPDKTAGHRLLYYFSRLPNHLDRFEAPDWSARDEGLTKKRTLPARINPDDGPWRSFNLEKEPILPKVGYWEVDGHCWPRVIQCRDVCCWAAYGWCCENRAWCAPWNCWFKIGYFFGCTTTLPAEEYAKRDYPDIRNIDISHGLIHYFSLASSVNYYDSDNQPLDRAETRFAIVRRDKAAPIPPARVQPIPSTQPVGDELAEESQAEEEDEADDFNEFSISSRQGADLPPAAVEAFARESKADFPDKKDRS